MHRGDRFWKISLRDTSDISEILFYSIKSYLIFYLIYKSEYSV